MMRSSDNFLLEFPYAHGKALGTGRLRVEPEDFFVEEVLAFEPSGEGEHVLLFIEKRELNTDEIARGLARQLGLKGRDVSYAGMKDRRAVTRQWFSVTLPGQPIPETFDLPAGASLLQVTRHSRKLKKGGLKANRFVLRIRELNGDIENLETRLKHICSQGVPNYFGEQRFGRQRNNLVQAERLFQKEIRPKRHQQGLYLSAARSWLFNLVLAERVRQGNWNQAINGDALIFDDSLQFFVEETISGETIARLKQFEIHPGGPLWGKGQDFVCGDAISIEQQVLAPYTDWCAALERMGLKQQRRSFRLLPKEMQYQWMATGELELRFTLPRGSYATSVMRELFEDIGPGNQGPGSRPGP